MDTILGFSENQLRQDRTSVKWVAFAPDVLPLWVAEMDAAPCPAVVEAVTQAVRQRQADYIAQSNRITLAEVQAWPWRRRIWNNLLSTLSPIL